MAPGRADRNQSKARLLGLLSAPSRNVWRFVLFAAAVSCQLLHDTGQHFLALELVPPKERWKTMISLRNVMKCEAGFTNGSVRFGLFGSPPVPANQKAAARSLRDVLTTAASPHLRLVLRFTDPQLLANNYERIEGMLAVLRTVLNLNTAGFGVGRCTWEAVSGAVPEKYKRVCGDPAPCKQNDVVAIENVYEVFSKWGASGSGQLIVYVVESLFLAGITASPVGCPGLSEVGTLAGMPTSTPGTVMMQIGSGCDCGPQQSVAQLGQVLAHEIAHALGLCHVPVSPQYVGNLMLDFALPTNTKLANFQVKILKQSLALSKFSACL